MFKSCITIVLLMNSILAFCQDQLNLKEEISNIESIKVNKDNLNIETRRNGKVLVIRESSESHILEAYSIQSNSGFISMMLSTLKDIQSISLSLNLLRTYSDSHFYSSFENCSCQNAPRRVIESYKENWRQAENKLSGLRLSNQIQETAQTIELNERINSVLEKLDEVNTSKINETVGYSYYDIRKFVAIDNIPANEKKIEELYQAVEELKSSIIQYLSFVNFLN